MAAPEDLCLPRVGPLAASVIKLQGLTCFAIIGAPAGRGWQSNAFGGMAPQGYYGRGQGNANFGNGFGNY